MLPLISIIVPCYNQAQYLDECLQSVCHQIYENWECLIINDGSPDNTEEVAKKWVEKDSRFKYFFKENGGLSSARNFGIERADGDWILPLDSDDYISNDYLSLAQEYFRDEKIRVIYCNAQKFGIINEKWQLKGFSLMGLATENMIFCSSLFRKKDWEKVGGYDENLKLGYEDWEFWISILKNGDAVLQLEHICFFYRIKENSMIVNLLKNNKSTSLKYIEKKHLDFFHKYLGSLNGNYRLVKAQESNIQLINKRFFNRVINKLYSLCD